MKNGKRLLALLLALLMVFLMAACSSGKGNESALSDDPEDTESENFWGDDSDTSGDSSEPADVSGDVSGDNSSGGTTKATKKDDKPSKTTAPTRKTVDEFNFPKLSFSNKTVRVMTTSDVAASKEIKDKLKAQYGLDLKEEYVSWGEIPTKLSAAVLAGTAPDAVRYRSDNPDMPSFIVKNLVQPIDGLMNLKDKIYADVSTYYDQTKWNNQHYLLIDSKTVGSLITYNKKLFSDYNVEDPWELYKAGKWNWDKFAEISSKFKDDTDKDGEQDRYGFVLNVPPSAFVYTTGETFGKLDGANQKITNNIKSANIARAMSFLFDQSFTRKNFLAVIMTGGEKFQNSIAAMTSSESIDVVDTSKQLAFLAKKGNLGIVPMPRDPKADKDYYMCRLTGWFVPRTAANPTGAVAYNAVRRYFDVSTEAVNAQKEAMKKNGFTDLNIEQMYANWTYGTPVFEFCPFIGYDSVWMSLQDQVAWTTQIAQDAPTVQATIDDIFTKEVEQATGPKVVENFEKYGTDLKTPINKYTAFTGGSEQIGVYLDKTSPYQGKYNGRIDYTVTKGTTFAALTRTLNSSWKGNTKMTFWAKSDGKGTQKMQVQIRSGGAPFNCMVDVTDAGDTFSLNLSDFKLADWWTDKTAKLDLGSISSIVLNFEGKEGDSRSVFIDMIEVKS